jgi:hypothetical protein
MSFSDHGRGSLGASLTTPGAEEPAASEGLLTLLVPQFRGNSEALTSARKSAALAALVCACLAVLILGVGLHGTFNLSAEDALYGDNCGSAPPSYHILSDFVDYYALSELQTSARTNKTDSSSPSAAAPETDKSDGESCKASYECDSGICSGPTQILSSDDSKTTGICVLSDYASYGWSQGAYLHYSQDAYFTVEAFFAGVVFMASVGLTVAHQPYYGAAWKVSLVVLLAAGYVAGIDHTIAGPMFAVYLLFGVPSALILVPAGIFFAGVAFLLTGEHSLENIALQRYENMKIPDNIPEIIDEVGRLDVLIYPALASFLLALALAAHHLQMSCRKCCIQEPTSMPGWDRTSRGFQMFSTMTASARKPRVLSRAMSITGWLGLLTVVLYAFSTNRASFLSDQMLDCSEFDMTELRGVGHLQAKCYLWPSSGMKACPHGDDPSSAADANAVATGMYSDTDPLASSFIWNLRVYKAGLVFLAMASMLAVFAARPETHTKRADRARTSEHGSLQWNLSLAPVAPIAVIAALLMAWGAHGMFNIDADDVLFGDSAGGPPPYGPLEPYISGSEFPLLLIDIEDAQARTDHEKNATWCAPNCDDSANDVKARSVAEGGSCKSNGECTSDNCVRLSSKADAKSVCVLEDFAEYAGDQGRYKIMNAVKGIATTPYWQPVYAAGMLSVSALLPIKFFGPGLSTFSAAALIVAASKSWFTWAGVESFVDWLDENFAGHRAHSLRNIYASLVDCSDFSGNEMRGAATLTGSYYCYDGPQTTDTTSATFHSATGGCQTTDNGKCAQSPNYPSNYGNNEDCSISVSGTAYLRSDAFSTESCCDHVTVNGNEYSGQSPSDSPNGVQVTSRTTLSWQSDGSGRSTGFKLCLVGSPPEGGHAPGVAGNMLSTLVGIKGPTRRNPVLAEWVTANGRCGVGSHTISGFGGCLTDTYLLTPRRSPSKPREIFLHREPPD